MVITNPTARTVTAGGSRGGRPRSEEAQRAILDAAQELLIAEGFSGLRLEHVAARAGVSKATIYRRWSSKEELSLAVLEELAAPHIRIVETGDTREELLSATANAMHAVVETPFGPVIEALLSQIAMNPLLGDPFRATIVQGRRDEVRRAIARGIARGDIRKDAEIDVATELLVGPVYFRLMFGGELTRVFAERIVDTVLRGYASAATDSPAATTSPSAAAITSLAGGPRRG